MNGLKTSIKAQILSDRYPLKPLSDKHLLKRRYCYLTICYIQETNFKYVTQIGGGKVMEKDIPWETN